MEMKRVLGMEAGDGCTTTMVVLNATELYTEK